MALEELFEPNQSFDDYAERFKDHFALRREDGILEVRMHDGGGETPWKKEFNQGWGALLKAIGSDTENEVLILGSTGEHWTVPEAENAYVDSLVQFKAAQPELYHRLMLDNYQRVVKNMRALLYDIDIPTIGVINGPAAGGHNEMALLCDTCLCAPDASFCSFHFSADLAPGDGFFAIMQKLAGPTRANWRTYTGEPFGAEEALAWGMVGEIVPTADIYDRAWEIARGVMEQPRVVRRMSHALMRKPMRDHIDAVLNEQAMASTLSLC